MSKKYYNYGAFEIDWAVFVCQMKMQLSIVVVGDGYGHLTKMDTGHLGHDQYGLLDTNFLKSIFLKMEKMQDSTLLF